MGDRGKLAVHEVEPCGAPGEIVGVAGVSGNGQRELMEALVGQRAARWRRGAAWPASPIHATRAENRRLKVRSLPEEPLRNACVGELSVAHNMALRDFDEPPLASGGWAACWSSGLAQRARELIAEYGVKTQGEGAPIRTLSGGNVQRAVLARELAGEADVLLAANPVFGLDFAAVAEIHGRLVQVRAPGRRGAAGQRRPGRAAAAVRPHRGDERRPHRLRNAGRRRRPPGAGRPHGRRRTTRRGRRMHQSTAA